MNTTVRTFETRNNIYYLGFGCITNYERTEQEKAEQRYMIIQKLIGVVVIVLAALSLLIVKHYPEIGIGTVILAFYGVILTFTNKHAISL